MTTSLWNGGTLYSRKQQQYEHIVGGKEDDAVSKADAATTPSTQRPPKGSLSDFFFGFMYEEDDKEGSIHINGDDDDSHYHSTVETSTPIFNSLNLSLSVYLILANAASSVPVILVNASPLASSSGIHAPRIVSAAVSGAAMGKLLNGILVDLVGARRMSITYACLLSVVLIFLSALPTGQQQQPIAVYCILSCCFLVEFFSSVQWPCCIVLLATHYRGNNQGMYEGGIFVTSLASRLGSLSGVVFSSLLLQQHSISWRTLALIAGWAALVASSVAFFYVDDSPQKANDPQNPIDPTQMRLWQSGHMSSLRFFSHVIRTNVAPSVRHVLCNGMFWIVALGHTGGSMVRSSERILGSYFHETSHIAKERAAALAVCMSTGTCIGLLTAGRLFASMQERPRKWMVARLYIISIVACYLLAFFAIPAVGRWLDSDVLLAYQVMTAAIAGFGVSVQLYHIPSLVGATFGCDKGLYAALNDGVAYGIASFVWRIVNEAVEEQESGGWMYGWAAVALMLVLSSILMVEFMEHYFCRRQAGGNYYYETLMVA